MCGRYTLTAPDPTALRGRFPLGETVAIRPRFNVAPTDAVLAVTTDREGTPRGGLLQWGLIPGWADSPEVGARMINARLETAAEKPAFRTAMTRYRCLIVADGFYEWRRRTTPEQPVRQPFWITREDHAPFAFAGLWSIWHGPGEHADQVIRSCAILTRAARGELATLHDREPVILDPTREADWLDPRTPAMALPDLLADPPAPRLALRAVGTTVNRVANDSPDCLAPPAQATQTALF